MQSSPSAARATNWAGNYRYRAARILEPRSVEELQQHVHASRRVRVLGTRHAFNDLPDTTGDLISMARLPRQLDIDTARRRATVDGGARYGDVCALLDEAGFALHNLASLPHVSIAGACTTSTHGSGDRNGSLATAVSRIEIVAADGELRWFERGDDDFGGAVVALGGLGAVVRLTLEVEPAFSVRQDVYEGLGLSTVVESFDAIMSSADSVSLFTEWRAPVFDQVWLKRRTWPTDDAVAQPRFFDAVRATRERHPIRGRPSSACTPQLGAPGPWHERLPHFRLEETPSAGDELQTEYQVPRDRAVDALLAVAQLRDEIAPLLQVCEVRSIAADDLWLSPSFARPSIAIHFTWLPAWDGVRAVMQKIERALAPFEPRPHWGKLFSIPAQELRARYPRVDSAATLLARHDPDGKFRNDFLDRYVFGMT